MKSRVSAASLFAFFVVLPLVHATLLWPAWNEGVGSAFGVPRISWLQSVAITYSIIILVRLVVYYAVKGAEHEEEEL